MNRDRITGEARTEAEGGTVESHMQMKVGATEERRGAGSEIPPGGRAADRAEALGARAGEVAEQARDRLIETASRVGAAVEERTGLLRGVRGHPVAAVGLAFSLGFLVAAASGGSGRNWILERARRQLRAAIIGGATAALAHELRTILGADEGLAHLLQSYLGDDNGDGDEEMYDRRDEPFGEAFEEDYEDDADDADDEDDDDEFGR
jgi:signal transduction histidine kinase